MASNVVEAFNEFMKNSVDLDKDETAKARSSRDWLVEQILLFPTKDAKFPDIYSDKNIFYGSFSRRTKKRPLDDIDMMICMKADGCTYNELSDKIEITVPETATRYRDYLNEGTNILNSRKVINAFVSKLAGIPQYKNADIKRTLEAATLNLQSYDWTFDIVPCFFTSEDAFKKTYYIMPDGKGNWMKTDPRKDKERIDEVNIKHKGQILKVIRAIKYWNKRPTMPTMSSYLIENMVLDYYANTTTTATQFVDVEVVKIFQDLKSRIYSSVIDPKGIQGDLNTLPYAEKVKIAERAKLDWTRATEGRLLEENNEEEKSINKWREIFGDEFPKFN